MLHCWYDIPNNLLMFAFYERSWLPPGTYSPYCHLRPRFTSYSSFDDSMLHWQLGIRWLKFFYRSRSSNLRRSKLQTYWKLTTEMQRRHYEHTLHQQHESWEPKSYLLHKPEHSNGVMGIQGINCIHGRIWAWNSSTELNAWMRLYLRPLCLNTSSWLQAQNMIEDQRTWWIAFIWLYFPSCSVINSAMACASFDLANKWA